MATSNPVIRPWAHIRDLLPQGMELPRATWNARHRFTLWVIAGHTLALPVFGLYRGWGWQYAIGEGAVIGALGIIAAMPRLSKGLRMVMASFALVTSSAVLVQFSGGYMAAHFHFFIVVAIVALYQDWVPFLLAILYVAFEHSIVGMIQPEWVFNHAGGHDEPWKWALIHALAILGECVALLTFWVSSEEATACSDLVLKSAGDGVIGLDAGGRITFANPAASALLGRSEDALIDQRIQSYIQGAAGAFADHRRMRGEGVLRNANGDELPVAWTMTRALRTGAGIDSVMTLRDISERRALEEELREHSLNLESRVERRTAQLTEANRELEAFSYTVSHDLRTPLRIVDGFSRILLERHGKSLPEESRQMMGMLADGAIRMSNLIESILSLSRLGRIELAHAPVDVSAVAEATLRELQAKQPERHVRWTVEPGLSAVGDAGLLRVALENLLSNAWKFTQENNEARIWIRREESPLGPAFVIADNGAGFDMAYSKELFQPFHRLHTPSQFQGSGIGLATVSRIVKRHKGQIWAEAAVGQGAKFSFTLGAAPAAAINPPGPAPVPEVRSAQHQATNVLVAH